MCKNCLQRGTFCHQQQKVPKERCQNQWFWIPCAGAVREVSRPFTPANKTVQPRPVLSQCLGVYSPRRAPRLCCPSKRADPLCLPCGAGHRTLRNTIGKRCVGDDAHIVPPYHTTCNPPVGADTPFRPPYRRSSVRRGGVLPRPITDEFPLPLRRGRCLHRPALPNLLRYSIERAALIPPPFNPPHSM